MTVSNAVTKPKTGKGAVIGTQGPMVLMIGWLISMLRGRRKEGERSIMGESHHHNAGRHSFGRRKRREHQLQVVSKQMAIWRESPPGK